jgi:polar amino acid transport system permease protein
MIRGEMRYLLRGLIGVPALLFLLLCIVYGKGLPEVLKDLGARSSQLLTGEPQFRQVSGGFCANVWISIAAMALATVGGTLLGIGLISSSRALRAACAVIMNVLRNSPWLVVLYAMLYLLPFEFRLFGRDLTFSPEWKSVVGLALPVGANLAEIFRGGVEAIPSGQWESARSLGYRRLQILRHIVVPQSIPLMLPNLMNLYAALFIGTSLIVVTGTADVLSMSRTIIATDGEHVATAVYLYVLVLFFLFSFPIAVGSRWLELRLQARA